MSRNGLTTLGNRGILPSVASRGMASIAFALCGLMVSGCVVDGHKTIGRSLLAKADRSSASAEMHSSRHTCPTCSAPLPAVEGAAPVPAPASASHAATVPAPQPDPAVPAIPVVPPEPSVNALQTGAAPPASTIPAAVGSAAAAQTSNMASTASSQPLHPYQKAMSQQGGPHQGTWIENQTARAQSDSQNQQPQTNPPAVPAPQQGTVGGFNEPWCATIPPVPAQNCAPVPQVAAIDECEDRVARMEQKMEALHEQLAKTQGALDQTMVELGKTKEATVNVQNLKMSLERQNQELRQEMMKLQRQQDQQLDLIDEALTDEPAAESRTAPQASSRPAKRSISSSSILSANRTRPTAVPLPTVEE
ncbi:MAG: hypothetical protein ACK58L_14875 [Planctomycetota bacterium]